MNTGTLEKAVNRSEKTELSTSNTGLMVKDFIPFQV